MTLVARSLKSWARALITPPMPYHQNGRPGKGQNVRARWWKVYRSTPDNILPNVLQCWVNTSQTRDREKTTARTVCIPKRKQANFYQLICLVIASVTISNWPYK